MTRKIDAKQAKLDRYWAKCDEDGGRGREGKETAHSVSKPGRRKLLPLLSGRWTLSGAVAGAGDDDDGDAFPQLTHTDSVAATLERAQ